MALNQAPKSHPISIIFSDFLATLCYLVINLKSSIIMSQTVELKVGMSCQGCVGAVKRVLGKLEGVESFDIDLEKQKVTVKGNVQPDVVLQTVSKTGKATSFWEAPAAKAPAAEPESKPTETVAAA